MDGISNAPHAPINSSGKDAPSRKLNAEAAWSSTYLNRRFLRHTNGRSVRGKKFGEGCPHDDPHPALLADLSLRERKRPPLPLGEVGPKGRVREEGMATRQ